MSLSKTCVIAGVGPGIGAAAARAFSREGYHVALLARSEGYLQTLAAELGNATAVVCDLSSTASIANAAKTIHTLPPVDVIVLNADDLLKAVAARTSGPLSLLQHLMPPMVERKAGSIFFTGATAALRGSANFAFVAIPAYTTRALAESMAREFMPQGIHVAHLILDGMVESAWSRQWKPDASPDDLIQPANVADTYLWLHRQPRSTWTSELVVRPAKEKW
ncbi:short-chain dehydrogenase/reductase SDR [Chytriomyces sp. MP71]|nr:short-chain dehydrogenase/reductase SDR [Chytriomyces sp. MP71]